MYWNGMIRDEGHGLRDGRGLQEVRALREGRGLREGRALSRPNDVGGATDATERVPPVRFKGFSGAWEEKRLGDVATFVGGGTPSTNVNTFWEGEIDWYTPAEIGCSKYVCRSQRRITSEGLKNCAATILPVGTILLTSRASIGLTAILRREAATNQGFQSMIVDDCFDVEFVFYLLATLVGEMQIRASGSTFLEISSSKLCEIPCRVPSLPEQKKIGAYFRALDGLIAGRREEVEKLKQMKKALLDRMFV